MKAPTILFVLIHARTVLSYDEGTRVAGCSVPCRTRLRLSESKMKECLETHCGRSYKYNDTPSHKGASGHFLEGEDENAEDYTGNSAACVVSGCKRQRYPERRDVNVSDTGINDSSSKQLDSGN
eukprot:704443_1